jgi:hypothetical protein
MRRLPIYLARSLPTFSTSPTPPALSRNGKGKLESRALTYTDSAALTHKGRWYAFVTLLPIPTPLPFEERAFPLTHATNSSAFVFRFLGGIFCFC